MRNSKGFTLVELLATIVILAIVMGIGSYAIVNLIRNAKDKNYELLIKNIKDGAEQCYQECRYNGIEDFCNKSQSSYTVTLSDLVNYGFLKGNSTDSDDKYTIVNPKDDTSIGNCRITITYSSKINIQSNSGSNCPSNEDYNG